MTDKIKSLLIKYTKARFEKEQVLNGRDFLSSNDFTKEEEHRILTLQLYITNCEAAVMDLFYEAIQQDVNCNKA